MIFEKDRPYSPARRYIFIILAIIEIIIIALIFIFSIIWISRIMPLFFYGSYSRAICVLLIFSLLDIFLTFCSAIYQYFCTCECKENSCCCICCDSTTEITAITISIFIIILYVIAIQKYKIKILGIPFVDERKCSKYIYDAELGLLNATKYRGLINGVPISTYFDNLNYDNYCKNVVDPLLLLLLYY